MDAFMSSMSANQATEWELFSKDNPAFDVAIVTQIAHIACFFASATLKKKDGSGFSPHDFIPWGKRQEERAKEVAPGIFETFKSLAMNKGDEKTKAWAGKDRSGKQERPKVRGTNGRWYTYALEEFATRTKLPRRVLNKVTR